MKPATVLTMTCSIRSSRDWVWRFQRAVALNSTRALSPAFIIASTVTGASVRSGSSGVTSPFRKTPNAASTTLAIRLRRASRKGS